MMNVNELPMGIAPQPVDCPHFPTRWQSFVWRNWGVVPTERLAEVLECTADTVRNAAEAMGLDPEAKVNPLWLTHGYLTVIRANWQLLSYEDLLILLKWTPEKMAYTLKEEDFLWIKVGQLKPDCGKLRYEPLTAEQRKKTEKLKAILHKFFQPGDMAYIDEPFAFSGRFGKRQILFSGRERFSFNYIHSYSASCGDVIGNANELDPVPENLLAQYASMGIKGVWIHALLYLLFPIPGAEEFSAGHEKRLENLRNMVKRCAKYGIKVYLYLNEPRCMPMAFYDKKPEWGGYDIPENNTRTVCTTRSPEPLQWLEESMRKLFCEAAGLGGVFCITMSENPTNCHFAGERYLCPHCKDVPSAKIIADVISAMERGMHAADPEAKMIAYDWAWRDDEPAKYNEAFKKAVMERLPKSVYIASVSEWGMITHVGGVEQYLVDYSISQAGPSEESLTTWRNARKLGLNVAAKVQINNSWELSAVPYIPVPYLIDEHLKKLEAAGVKGLMLSWTLGGFPDGNLDLLHAAPEEIAAAQYHPELAEKICRVWKVFSEAFRNFPFNIHVIYKGPMNYGPMNLLHLNNTGYQASMIGFPYDDLETWRGPYPAEIFANQFRLLTDGWKEGLDMLKSLSAMVRDDEQEAYNELCVISEASFCHLRSTYCQISFVMARNNGFDKEGMAAAVREEIELAQQLHEIVRRDSRIGFEASSHYYYTLNDLREKVVSCVNILEELAGVL